MTPKARQWLRHDERLITSGLPTWQGEVDSWCKVYGSDHAQQLYTSVLSMRHPCKLTTWQIEWFTNAILAAYEMGRESNR